MMSGAKVVRNRTIVITKSAAMDMGNWTFMYRVSKLEQWGNFQVDKTEHQVVPIWCRLANRKQAWDPLMRF